MRKLEIWVERILFGGRWLLAPLYLGLIGSLIAILVKFVAELIHLATNLTADVQEMTLMILALLDLTLLANLIVIVIYAGYENFVSKIGVAANSEDRPYWMGRVDYSGLKIKLIGSLVAISVIELLKDFMQAAETTDFEPVAWRIGIHLTFVVSGLLFAIMDLIGDRRVQMGSTEAKTATKSNKGE
jgi:uncharacterized protein (TIGR00645 family)